MKILKKSGKILSRTGGWLLPPLSGRIDTDTLVYPRRYDIVMRESFVEFYTAERKLYLEDRASFIAEARKLPYYRYFMGIPAASVSLRQQYPAEGIDQLFTRKAERFAILIESIGNGYDISKKIELKYHLRGPATGTLSIGNGCHRLAVLRNRNGRILDARYFTRTLVLSTKLRDNTAVLKNKNLLTDAELLEIASMVKEAR